MGYIADKLGHRKLLVLVGYGLTPIGQAFIALSFSAGSCPGWADPSGPFRLVFWLTLIPGGLAVLPFLTLVKDPGHSPNQALKVWARLRLRQIHLCFRLVFREHAAVTWRFALLPIAFSAFFHAAQTIGLQSNGLRI